jgi:hypothetical protein
MATFTPAPQATSVNNNLDRIGVLFARLGRIQNALEILDNQSVSLCHIEEKNNQESITRLLDPHLDDVVDTAISKAASDQLREEANKVITELEEMGIAVSDDVALPLLPASL